LKTVHDHLGSRFGGFPAIQSFTDPCDPQNMNVSESVFGPSITQVDIHGSDPSVSLARHSQQTKTPRQQDRWPGLSPAVLKKVNEQSAN
jgi:hypothetical protein